MDKPNTHWLAGETAAEQTVQSETASGVDAGLGRGSGQLAEVSATERTEHSVMEGLPPAKAERIAGMRRELADLQRQLIDAQQRIATELQGRVEDAERLEALEARLQAQETKAQQDGARIAELVTEVANAKATGEELRRDVAGRDAQIEELRRDVASRDTQIEELRRDVTTRDAQIEEARRQHSGVTERLEAQTSALNETKTLLQARDAELATRTGERDTEQETRSRLERELEDERKLVRELTSRVEAESASLRDARAGVAKRDGELATMTSERDAARAQLDAARAKMRDIAKQLADFGQDLGSDDSQTPSSSEPTIEITPRSASPSKPPPVPPPRTAAKSVPPPSGTAIRVGDEDKPSSRMGLGLVGGLILGVAATFAAVKWSNAAGETQDLAASPPAEVETDRAMEPAPSAQPMPAENTDVNAPAGDVIAPEPAATEEIIATDGVIVLPQEASGRRVYVDGRVVSVRNSRAVVPCGSREIRIGSRGPTRTFDVPCGGDTEVPPEPR